MAWTTPRDWVALEVVDEGELNANIRDNANALHTGAMALASQAAGDILYASSATQLGRVAGAAVGNVLLSNGATAAPVWGNSLTGSFTFTAYLVIGTAGAASTTAGDITAGRNATQGAIFFGGNGVGYIFRNGTTAFEIVGAPLIVTSGGQNNFTGSVHTSAAFIVEPTFGMYLDGGNDTYIKESSANVMSLYAGAVESVIVTDAKVKLAVGLAVGYATAVNAGNIYATGSIRVDTGGSIVAGNIGTGPVATNSVTALGGVFSTAVMGTSPSSLFSGVALYGAGSIDSSRGSGTGAFTNVNFINGNGVIGSISTSGSTTTYNTTSDSRLKRNLGMSHDTSVLRRTVVHDFEWIVDGTPGRGVFAQDAHLIKPSAVFVGTDARDEMGRLVQPWSIDYSMYVPDLIVGWQDLNERLTKLERTS